MEEKTKLISISSLLTSSFKIYQAGFWKFIIMALVPVLGALPLIIVLLLFGGAKFLFGESLTAAAASAINIVLGVIGIAAFIFLIYFAILAQAGILIMVKNFISGNKKTVKENLKEARQYMWMLFAINIIVGIFVFLWSVLLIIPGIIMAIFYSFAMWAFINEGYGSTSALKRSKELVKGYWWAVFGRIALLYLGIWIIMGIPYFFLQEKTPLFIAYDSIQSLISFLIGPFFIIYHYLIYLNLLKLKPESKIEKKQGKSYIIFIASAITAIILIGLLSTMAVVSLNGARAKARDAKRISDVKQIQSALESYAAKNNGSYPAKLEMLEGYSIDKIKNPEYAATEEINKCAGFENYVYQAKNNNQSYEIIYCLEENFQEYIAGKNTAKPE